MIAQRFNFGKVKKTTFPSPPDCEFQIGIGVIDENKIFETHIHKTIERKIQNTSEFIYVISGKMTIEILAKDKLFVRSIELEQNEGFLQFFGGHKITADACTRYFEIKQGPYFGRNFDKYTLNESPSK